MPQIAVVCQFNCGNTENKCILANKCTKFGKIISIGVSVIAVLLSKTPETAFLLGFP
jgi:hypothetical protein